MEFYMSLVSRSCVIVDQLLIEQIFVLGLGCTTVSWVDRFRTPAWRPYRAAMFIALGLSGIVPVIHGVSIYGYSGLNDRMSLSWVILHGAFYIFGAVLYAVRLALLLSLIFKPNCSRCVGRSGPPLDHTTSGAARTKFSTSLSFSQQRRIFTAWPRPLTITIPSWVPNVY